MSQPEQTASAGPLRVLILDDDPFMLDLLPEMLAQLGQPGQFEVRTERDARHALLALDPPPHLLICDLSMPEMDGIEFMHAASIAGFAGNVLLLSGMDSGVRMAAEHLATAHGLRVVGTYKKPISREQLGAALAPLLAGREGGPDISHNLTPLFGK
jgi:DNA-binding NarL/FixJ family response regulator